MLKKEKRENNTKEENKTIRTIAEKEHKIRKKVGWQQWFDRDV